MDFHNLGESISTTMEAAIHAHCDMFGVELTMKAFSVYLSEYEVGLKISRLNNVPEKE